MFWDIVMEGKIQIMGDDFPSFQITQFGYIAIGSSPLTFNFFNTICNFSKIIVPEDTQLKKFWEIEEIDCPKLLSSDDSKCEELFQKDTFRNKMGQFAVKITFKHSTDLLGTSRDTAVKRFLNLEKRFSNTHF